MLSKPSYLAKEFATAHGFTISPLVEKRYTITKTATGDTWESSSYPGALKIMHANVETRSKPWKLRQVLADSELSFGEEASYSDALTRQRQLFNLPEMKGIIVQIKYER